MRPLPRIVSFAAALAGAAAALAQNAPKEAPPAPGPAKDFSLPTIRRFDLPNGMQLRLMQYGDVPKATIRLVVQTGNIDEAADQVWLANVTGEMMQQGTTTRTAEEIAEQAALMGGSLDVRVGMNETTVGTDVFSDSAAAAVALIADVARHPRLPESELARIRSNFLRKLSIDHNEPRSLVSEKFNEILYPSQPYGRSYPTPEMLQGYTLDQIRGFHDRNFGAARSRMYVVGRFDEAAIERAIRAGFADWKAGAPPVPVVANPVTRPGVFLIDRPGSVQSTLLIGLPVIDPSHPDYRALTVANGILGGTFMSRITMNVREQKGYSYSPVSYVFTQPHSGYWVEDADVSTEVTGPFIREILREIERLRAEPPPAAELRGVQNFLAGLFVLFNSSREDVVSQLTSADRYGLGEDSLREYVQKIYAVTPADVQRLIRQYIDPAKLTIVIVGDQKAIEEQVKPFGAIVE
jgi:zinc protease